VGPLLITSAARAEVRGVVAGAAPLARAAALWLLAAAHVFQGAPDHIVRRDGLTIDLS
jgi:hypothetical protein